MRFWRGTGFVSALGGVREWSWDKTSFGHKLRMLEPDVFMNSTIAVIADSSSGGGYLEETKGGSLKFRADWDSTGHGSWWHYISGSGNW